MAEAAFTRKDTESGILFKVVPAPQYPGYTFKWGLLAATLFLLPLFIYLNSKASFVLVLLGLAMAAPCLLPIWRDMAKRKPASLTVSPDALIVDGHAYNSAEIAELYLKEPRQHDRIVYGNGLTVAGAQLGSMIDRSHNRRSLSLILRMRDGSKATPIVFGLTPEAGASLLNDLGHALGLAKA